MPEVLAIQLAIAATLLLIVCTVLLFAPRRRRPKRPVYMAHRWGQGSVWTDDPDAGWHRCKEIDYMKWVKGKRRPVIDYDRFKLNP